ncbi:CB1 cannabinoid receptor-interacting protein 1 [Rhipicephalus sanguineus]|uniref:CB1 cannabinoid receptor-interacting protein 1 n=1 Tax=Rhipicephalus sanguineus TaxID=34632 RepID=UPI001894680F|nr:CB1 cannabinoid receptor-interacting protein 1 [Rhipicephalus sanguineus]
MGDDSSRSFKVVLTMQREGNNNGDVHYKVDGTRFGSESTIKLNVETSYTLTLCFRPAQTLESISLMGSRYSPKEKSRDHASSTYCITWSSLGVGVTKHGKRDKIPLALQILDVGELLVNLQVKFYKEKDKEHATWGNALHQIDLDCEVSRSSGSLVVNKQSFR